MENKKAAATISDIAKLAEVSVATVCRVLNEKNNVAEKLRLRVINAIEVLDYKPQRIHNKIEPWFVILTDSTINAFTALVLSAINSQAVEKGFVPFIVQLPQNERKRTEVLNKIQKQNWSGMISCGFYQSDEAWIKLQETMKLPMVLLNSKASHRNIACIRVNFQGAISDAIHHLTNLGHRHIAFLGDLSDQFCYDEMLGVESALAKLGYTYPDEYRISVSLTAEGASQGISQLMFLPEGQRPTAIISFDDEFSVHILNALHYHELSIPEDISIVGFDNIPIAAQTHPPLTTIDVPKYRIGQQLVDLMLQLIENKPSEPIGYIVINGSLIVRGSTGLAPRTSLNMGIL